MKLIEQIEQQCVWFWRQNLKPTVVLCPYQLRHRLLGELAEMYLVDFRNGVDQLKVMGMRIVFSHNIAALEVAMTLA